MSRYLLMPAAKQDLADIRSYYLEEAGYRVAWQMVVEFRETLSLSRPLTRRQSRSAGPSRGAPDLFWPMRDYLILYKPETNPLEILSIIRGSRDLPALIGRRKL